ncbi:nicotinamidase/pyrazinamidase [Phycisphaerae bacterium RAS1]|nr:nicotinamidase/pyrazinamidase [Phycisphaerae bacterium RAS1]
MNSLASSDVLIDICTQRDYLSPGGACLASNADDVARNVRHLMALARWAHAPTLSCVDVHRVDEMRGLPRPHCIVGTLGQKKLGCTMLPDHAVIDCDNRLCVPLDVLALHQQVILSKHHRDPFTNPKFDRLLTEMPAGRFIIFGVALEASLKLLSLGLLLRGRRVALIHDACAYWNASDADMAIRQLAAKGCDILSTSQWVTQSRAAQSRRRKRPAA